MPPTDAEGKSSEAIDALFQASYEDLRRLARARLQGGGRNTLLDTTALIHESYLRLTGRGGIEFPDRLRFLVYAGKVFRSVIVDLVRQRQTERHGGEAGLVTLTTQLENVGASGEDQILKVNDALEELRNLDERMAQVVEMRYFAGMTEIEIAQALNVTDRTVRRDWQQARLFLAEALS